jgi:hypothetical protein
MAAALPLGQASQGFLDLADAMVGSLVRDEARRVPQHRSARWFGGAAQERFLPGDFNATPWS